MVCECACESVCSISFSYGRLAKHIFHGKRRPSDVLVIANRLRKLLFYFYFCARGGILIKFFMDINKPFHMLFLFHESWSLEKDHFCYAIVFNCFAADILVNR